MKISELPPGIHQKLWDIQRKVRPVATEAGGRRGGEDGDDSRYMEAAAVFAEVRPHLARRHLLVIPGRAVPTPTSGGVAVELHVTIRDLENLEEVEGAWAGEGDTAAGATTNALKGFFVAVFQVVGVTPAEDRNARRRKAVKKAPAVTASQIKLIRGVCRERQISDEDFTALLRDRYAIAELDKLPRASVTELLDALGEMGEEVQK